MSTEKQVLKWSGFQIIKFLDIFRKYDGLWDTNNVLYIKRTARELSFKKLVQELIEAGFEIPNEDILRKKIKNLKDAYRNEVNKVNKSKINGSGIEDVYRPKLLWFDQADSFWRNVISARNSASNLDLSPMTQNTTADVLDSNHEKGEQQNDTCESAETQLALRLQPVSDSHIGSPEPPKKKLKLNKRNAASSFETSVSKLYEIAEMANANTEDQYSCFGNHIASQLRELPVRNFIVLQEKIQSLISQERLATIQTPSPSTCQPSPCHSNVEDSPSSRSNHEMTTDSSEVDNVQAALLQMWG